PRPHGSTDPARDIRRDPHRSRHRRGAAEAGHGAGSGSHTRIRLTKIAFRSEPIPTHLPWGTTISRPYGGTRRDLQEVVALAQNGHIKAHVERFALTDASEVLEKLEQGNIAGRAVL